MADNTKLKELQEEINKTHDFISEAKGRFQHMDDRFDQIENMLQTLAKSMDALQYFRSHKSPSGVPGGSNSSDPSMLQSMNYAPSYVKSIKMDFPRFDGSDALNWIFKAEQYFKYYEVAEAQKLVLASDHMDGDVLPWFQMMEKAQRIPHWYALARAVEKQFDPSKFDCARSQLFILTQQGTLDEYNTRFMALSNRAEDIPEAALLDCYIGGLQPDLKRHVLVHRPTTVISAMSLAYLYVDATAVGTDIPKPKVPAGGITSSSFGSKAPGSNRCSSSGNSSKDAVKIANDIGSDLKIEDGNGVQVGAPAGDDPPQNIYNSGNFIYNAGNFSGNGNGCINN